MLNINVLLQELQRIKEHFWVAKNSDNAIWSKLLFGFNSNPLSSGVLSNVFWSSWNIVSLWAEISQEHISSKGRARCFCHHLCLLDSTWFPLKKQNFHLIQLKNLLVWAASSSSVSLWLGCYQHPRTPVIAILSSTCPTFICIARRLELEKRTISSLTFEISIINIDWGDSRKEQGWWSLMREDIRTMAWLNVRRRLGGHSFYSPHHRDEETEIQVGELPWLN